MIAKPFENFHVVTDDRGVTTVSLDVPGRPLNVLTFEVMEELEQIVRSLENDKSCRLAVFQSEKESGFLAGADVAVIAGIESPAHALHLIEQGQSLFQRIEWLPMPTLAVLHGPCLGGGLELSLCCKYRVARDNGSTQIGLPEIKLGLIPGWGGTQRLPRIAGLTNALSMILTGKHLSASEAYQIGLVDLAINPDDWQSGVEGFIANVLQGSVKDSGSRRPRWQRMFESTGLGRSMVMRMTQRGIASKLRHYPALGSALRAVQAGFKSSPEGYLCERNEFVDLLVTPTCRNLLDLFFARERARSQTTWCSSTGGTTAAPVRTVGVVGAGAMGAGIGQLAAVRGYDVVLKEVNPQAAAAGQHRLDKLIDDYARRKGLDRQAQQRLCDKISISCDDSSLADCDLVVEAVVEREDVKAQVFRSLDQVVQSTGMLTSNTSSLSVTRMAEATQRPSLVAGLHFFNPVHRMELVEVVRAAQTDETTIARLVAFVRALGKTPIVTSDSPGFLVNRVLFPYLGEAILMVGEGFRVADIDRQVRSFGMPMGPLELLDQVGIDVALHVAGSLDGVLPGLAPVHTKLEALVSHGHLGKKSSLGFYEYRKGRRRNAAALPMFAVNEPPESDRHGFEEDSLNSIQRRLIYPMLTEAARCHEEGVVDAAWAIDLAMVLGTGFAPHRGGPLHVIDSIGLDAVRTNLKRLEDLHGHRFSAPAELVAMCRDGERFFGKETTGEQLVAP